MAKINPEPYESNETYKLKLFFEKQAILRSDKLALQKLVESVWLKIHHNLSKEQRRCRWPEISRPLLKGIDKAEEYDFIAAVNRYIDEVFATQAVKSLHIVVHPHQNHFSNDRQIRYVLYAGKLIRSALTSNRHRSKIFLVDFSDQNIGAYLQQPHKELFQKGDLGSHLTDEIHGTEFTPRILEQVAKQFKPSDG